MHPALRAPRSNRLPQLDALRFVAAAGVALFHLAEGPGGALDRVYTWLVVITRYGYLGIHLFFMISGFVILWTAYRRNAREFIIARATRLYPTFWICVLLTTAAHFLFDVNGGPDPGVVAVNLTMLAGFVHVPYLDGVYWTLTAELKFYGLVLLLILTHQLRAVEYWLAAWLIALCLASVFEGPRWLRIVTIFPVGSFFISGCLIYLVRSEGLNFTRAALLAGSMGLSAFLGAAEQQVYTNVDTTFARVIVGAAIVVFHLAFFFLVTSRYRLSRPQSWYWLGCLTYPLYLLHNELGARVSLALLQTLSPWPRLMITLMIVLILSAVIAYYVEHRAARTLRTVLSRQLAKLTGRRQASP